MLGWSIRASACRSASNRARTWAESMPGLMTLRATRRRTGRSCSAMKTAPMPPSPICWSNRYGPIWDPGPFDERGAGGRLGRGLCRGASTVASSEGGRPSPSGIATSADPLLAPSSPVLSEGRRKRWPTRASRGRGRSPPPRARRGGGRPGPATAGRHRTPGPGKPPAPSGVSCSTATRKIFLESIEVDAHRECSRSGPLCYQCEKRRRGRLRNLESSPLPMCFRPPERAACMALRSRPAPARRPPYGISSLSSRERSQARANVHCRYASARDRPSASPASSIESPA